MNLKRNNMTSLKYLGWRFKDRIYYPTRQFIKNIWKFRKELSKHYDWSYDLGLFRRSIELSRDYIRDHGHEVVESSSKKVHKMNRAIYLLKRFEEDEFRDLAEERLGYEYVHGNIWFEPCEDRSGSSYMRDDLTEEQTQANREIFLMSIEIQGEMWRELWQIIQGQDYKSFDKEIDFSKQFDGSGLLGWWD